MQYSLALTSSWGSPGHRLDTCYANGVLLGFPTGDAFVKASRPRVKVVLFLSPIMPYLREAAHTAHRTKQGPGPPGVKSPLRGLVFKNLICENKFSQSKSDKTSSEGTNFSGGKKFYP